MDMKLRMQIRKEVTQAVIQAAKGDVSPCTASNQVANLVERLADDARAEVKGEIATLHGMVADLRQECDLKSREIARLNARQPLFVRLFGKPHSHRFDTVKLGA